jgi:hypothetical protein
MSVRKFDNITEDIFPEIEKISDILKLKNLRDNNEFKAHIIDIIPIQTKFHLPNMNGVFYRFNLFIKDIQTQIKLLFISLPVNFVSGSYKDFINYINQNIDFCDIRTYITIKFNDMEKEVNNINKEYYIYLVINPVNNIIVGISIVIVNNYLDKPIDYEIIAFCIDKKDYKGLGNLLMDFIKLDFKKKNYKGIVLVDSVEESKNFYIRQGFTKKPLPQDHILEDGENDDYYIAIWKKYMKYKYKYKKLLNK